MAEQLEGPHSLASEARVRLPLLARSGRLVIRLLECKAPVCRPHAVKKSAAKRPKLAPILDGTADRTYGWCMARERPLRPCSKKFWERTRNARGQEVHQG